MNLYERMAAPCTRLILTETPDSSGGMKPAWAEGEAFTAAIVKDNTLAARVAEKSGVTAVYTLTVVEGSAPGFHDVFRRDADGKTFRVTSNPEDSAPPEGASFFFEQVSCEEWEVNDA